MVQGVGGGSPPKVQDQVGGAPSENFRHFHFEKVVKNINFGQQLARCSCQLITLKLL